MSMRIAKKQHSSFNHGKADVSRMISYYLNKEANPSYVWCLRDRVRSRIPDRPVYSLAPNSSGVHGIRMVQRSILPLYPLPSIQQSTHTSSRGPIALRYNSLLSPSALTPKMSVIFTGGERITRRENKVRPAVNLKKKPNVEPRQVVGTQLPNR